MDFILFFRFFKYLFYLSLFIFGFFGSLLLHTGVLQLRRLGATLCRGVLASHCGAFSCCGAWALGAQASVVVAHGLSSCGSRALEHWLSSCGTRLSCSTAWHVGSSWTRARTRVRTQIFGTQKSLNPQCDGVWTLGGNQSQMRSWGWSPHDGISALIRRDTRELVFSLLTPYPPAMYTHLGKAM